MKKSLAIVLVLVTLVTGTLLTTLSDVQAASYKKAYKKALTTTVSGGIYSRYAYIKVKGFSKPVMMILKRDGGNYEDYVRASFYYYKSGKVKKLSSSKLYGGIDIDDWKMARNGKKYVLYVKKGTWKVSYVLKKKRGKIESTMYSTEKVSNSFNLKYSVGTTYFEKNGKQISKTTFNKAVKTTKKVKLKEHFAEREY